VENSIPAREEKWLLGEGSNLSQITRTWIRKSRKELRTFSIWNKTER